MIILPDKCFDSIEIDNKSTVFALYKRQGCWPEKKNDKNHTELGTIRAKSKHEQLNNQLLNHTFTSDKEFLERYNKAKIVARHYCMAENAIAVLSNMPLDTSYICYGHLGERLGLGNGAEEVVSIWEQKLMRLIHPDDVAEKIAWELQFLSFISQLPVDERSDYYLQHFMRMRGRGGDVLTVRHRIFYLDYDADGNVLLTLCLYSVVGQNAGVAGIVHSLDDTLANNPSVGLQGLLSVRERGILELVSSGKASKQIADLLNISTNTVNNHRQSILHKLHCHNTAEAVVVAGKLGILSSK